MPKRLVLVVAIAAAMASSRPGQAQQLIQTYQAFLGDSDHVHANGERLHSAAAIIRRDRENFHKFGRKDPGDENDGVFAEEKNRAALERWMARGTTDQRTKYRIVRRTLLVRVELFRGPRGRYVNVTVVE